MDYIAALPGRVYNAFSSTSTPLENAQNLSGAVKSKKDLQNSNGVWSWLSGSGISSISNLKKLRQSKQTKAPGARPQGVTKSSKRIRRRNVRTPSLSNGHHGRTSRSASRDAEHDHEHDAGQSLDTDEETNPSDDVGDHYVSSPVKLRTSTTMPTPNSMKTKYQERQRKLHDLASDGWAEPDMALFRRIEMRGFQPLLPKEWERMLLSLPPQLFTDDDAEALFRAWTPRKSHKAWDSLTRLLDMGVRARSKFQQGLPTEVFIAHEIANYFDFVVADLGIEHKTGWLPVWKIITPRRGERAFDLQLHISESLGKLRDEWIVKLRKERKRKEVDVPPLYGVIVSQTIIAIVTRFPDGHRELDGSQVAPLHTIGLYDLNAADHDVWNAFAVAILGAHCREVLDGVLRDHPGIVTGKKMKKADPDA